MIRTSFILSLVFILFMPEVAFARSNNLKSYVILLVDFSNSYFKEDRKDTIQENLLELTNAIASKKYGPKRPVRTTVLPINHISEASRKICEFTILRKRLLKKPKETKNSKFKPRFYVKYMETLCSNTIARAKVQLATDIHGALSLASQFSASHPTADKFLVIFSDMFEYRDESIPVTKIDLRKFKVLVVCSRDLNVEKQGSVNLCMGQKDNWQEAFSRLGAEEIIFVREGTNWGSEITQRLFQK